MYTSFLNIVDVAWPVKLSHTVRVTVSILLPFLRMCGPDTAMVEATMPQHQNQKRMLSVGSKRHAQKVSTTSVGQQVLRSNFWI